MWPRKLVAAEYLSSPSFSGVRSTPWNPQLRGNAVRRRYPGGTNRGIPAQSARMTADFERRGRSPHATNRGIPARSARMTCIMVTAYRGASVNVDAEAQTLRHSEATQWPWNPLWRGTRPTVDAETKVLRHSEGYAVPRLGREPSEVNRVRKGGARERE